MRRRKHSWIFSNILPDFIVVAAREFRRYGYGDVLGCGYFNADWTVGDASAYMAC